MAWASGQRLQGGKYTIEQELGEGGFGITYLARENNRRKVVIKTLNDTLEPKEINPNISDRVNQAILKGMEVKPEDRPTSIQEWLALLQTNNDACASPLQIVGTWSGEFGSGKATLSITHQFNDSFKGILIHEHWWNGTAKVAINGNLDPKTNDVIIRELEIISGYWRLGENQGNLSSDGRHLFGRGKDTKGLYKWSFQRLN